MTHTYSLTPKPHVHAHNQLYTTAHITTLCSLKPTHKDIVVCDFNETLVLPTLTMHGEHLTPVEGTVTAHTITQLRTYQTPVIVLTARHESKVAQTQRELIECNIPLPSPHAPKTPAPQRLHTPHGTVCHENGIICSGTVGKGEALIAFLKAHTLSPQRVIFVDDTYRHIDNIFRSCTHHGLTCIGIHYPRVRILQAKELTAQNATRAEPVRPHKG